MDNIIKGVSTYTTNFTLHTILSFLPFILKNII